MKYTIYQITNNLNEMIYIGRHQTNNLDDDYMGSGKYLKSAQQKYGLENFSREYLHIFDNDQDMFLKEEELVTEEFCSRKDTYNIMPGGFAGGWDYINDNGLGIKLYNESSDHKESSLKGGISSGLLPRSEKQKQSTKLGHILGKYRYDGMLGKSHSKESKRKISKANSESQLGNKNSQFGSMWITNGIISKKIKKENLIPEGWNRGRKLA